MVRWRGILYGATGPGAGAGRCTLHDVPQALQSLQQVGEEKWPRLRRKIKRHGFLTFGMLSVILSSMRQEKKSYPEVYMLRTIKDVRAAINLGEANLHALDGEARRELQDRLAALRLRGRQLLTKSAVKQ